MNFQTRLRQLRKELGLNTYAFAEQIGVSRAAVTTWEQGRNYPGQPTIKLLADFFGVSRDYLAGDTEIREKPDDLIKKYVTHEEYQSKSLGESIAKRVNKLDKTRQAKLIAYLECLEFLDAKGARNADL